MFLTNIVFLLTITRLYTYTYILDKLHSKCLYIFDIDNKEYVSTILIY